MTSTPTTPPTSSHIVNITGAPVPADPTEEWRQEFLHEAASIGEGFCPKHRGVRLEPAVAADGPAGRHPGCGWWYLEMHSTDPALGPQIVHWATDLLPVYPYGIRVPEWILSYG